MRSWRSILKSMGKLECWLQIEFLSSLLKMMVDESVSKSVYERVIDYNSKGEIVNGKSIWKAQEDL